MGLIQHKIDLYLTCSFFSQSKMIRASLSVVLGLSCLRSDGEEHAVRLPERNVPQGKRSLLGCQNLDSLL